MHNNALVGYYASDMHPEHVQSSKQVCQMQRQIFGRKSERRLPEPDGVQGTLGESEVTPLNRKSKILAYERTHKPNAPLTAPMDDAVPRRPEGAGRTHCGA